MLAGGENHPVAGARCDVNMRIDAPLADQLQLRQTIQQGRLDLRPLADQYQRLGVL